MANRGQDRVAVIGAGIAGLVTAKVLREDGFDVTVFEKESGYGGVWLQSRTYPGLRANNSRDTYAFSDHPYPKTADRFPTAPQIRDYLASYVARFTLESSLRRSTEVARVARAGAGFELEVVSSGSSEVLTFDYVVVCAGTFSEPQVPEVEGADRFGGKLLHSSEAIDPGLSIGQRVVVVGAGKSALDCAAYASSQARECTLVLRNPYWMAPRYLPGRIPIDRLMMTRLSEALFPYHRANRFERFLQGRGARLARLTLKGTLREFQLQLRMPPVHVPAEPYPVGIEVLGVASEFFAAARAGKVTSRRDRIESFPGGDTVQLASGEQIAADVVIFATGWRQPLSFLDSELRAMVVDDGHFRLYRHIVPPAEPRLGFIGYASSTACQLSAEVSAHWLSQMFRGELELPPAESMDAEIDRVHAWLREAIPGRADGYYVGVHVGHHIDELMIDMGLPTRRKRNVITEYALPLFPKRYRGLAEERRRVRAG
jgi:cation diffusion facilitator CzcD-associated flavoprotein CzcO